MNLSPIPPQPQAHIVIPDDRPAYRLKESFFGPDDTLWEEGIVIQYDDEPNKAMEPLNTLAIERMTEFLEMIDVEGQKKATVENKHYVSEAEAFKNSLVPEDQRSKKVQPLSGTTKQVPLMNAKKDSKSIRKMDAQTEAPFMGNSSVGKLTLNAKG